MGEIGQALVAASAGLRELGAQIPGHRPDASASSSDASAPTNTQLTGMGGSQAQAQATPSSIGGSQAQAQAAAPTGLDMVNPMDFMQESDPLSAVYDNPGQGPDQSQPQSYDNPYTSMDNPSSMLPTPEEGVTVEGDRWKPKGPGVLGDILDTFALMRGDAPMFRLKKNLPEIMEGFKSDPDEAIRRMEKVHGPTAWKMRQEFAQMDAATALAEARKAETKIKGYKALASSIDALPDDPEKAAQIYPKVLPLLRRRAEAYGIDPTEFSETYDADNLAAIRAGGTSVYEEERLGDFDLDRQGTAEHRRATRESIDTHRRETRAQNEEDDEIDNNLARERLDFDKTKPNAQGKPAPKNIFNRDTGEFRGILSPDGLKAAVRASDGKWYAYRLQKPGDVSSRVRSPGEDAIVRKQMGIEDGD